MEISNNCIIKKKTTHVSFSKVYTNKSDRESKRERKKTGKQQHKQ